MAKATAAARFVTEVAPPQVVSVMRRRKKVGLDTIVEDDRELPAYGPSPSDHQGFAAAWSRRPPAPARERAAGLMRELGKCSSDGHGQQQAAGGGGWEGAHKLGHRRVVKV